MKLSKHGSCGADTFPEVTTEQKQAFWNEYMKVFDGLLIDTEVSDVTRDTIGQLLERNHRVITGVADFAHFTDSTK